MRVSEFTEKFININSTLPFSFKGREYFKPIYDSDANAELFLTGRQVGKSMYLVNRMISRACLMPNHQILFEAPREKQSKQFSKQKLRPILNSSPKLKPFLKLASTGKIDGLSILEAECFKNDSRIVLSTTYDGGDRDRGASMNDLLVDEVQDQLEEDITVIAESLSAAADPYMCWAGTPKTFGNYIEQLWQRSRQIYWVIRCDSCNTWQVPGDPEEITDLSKVIAPEGLLCKKCSRVLNVLNGLWVPKNSKAGFNGWHVSQLLRLVDGMPGSVKWKTPEGIYGIYDKYQYYTPSRFYNEVLGFSYDSAEKPLTFSDIKNVCLPYLKKAGSFDPSYFTSPIIMGIDWGRNNVNFTVVSISFMYQGKPTLIYMKKFDGAETDPRATARIIKNLFKAFGCSAVFCDNGMFWHYEHEIRDVFGNDFVNDHFNFIHYWQDTKYLVRKSAKNKKLLWKVSRNEAMNLFINHVKQRLLSIYNFEQFSEEKFHMDYMAVGYEVREMKDKGETLFFMGSGEGGSPTDAFHSHMYSWLGLMLTVGRFKFTLDDTDTPTEAAKPGNYPTQKKQLIT